MNDKLNEWKRVPYVLTDGRAVELSTQTYTGQCRPSELITLGYAADIFTACELLEVEVYNMRYGLIYSPRRVS